MKSSLLVVLLWSPLSAQAAPRGRSPRSTTRPATTTATARWSCRSETTSSQATWTCVQLQISRDDEGYWFEATFKNPIRDPGKRVQHASAASRCRTSRAKASTSSISTSTSTPTASAVQAIRSRCRAAKVSIDAAFAWERAVILTPRPEAIRSRLIDVLEQQFPERPKGEAAASVDQSMFFPTRVRVRGKSVSFLVPAKFLGEGDAKHLGRDGVRHRREDRSGAEPVAPARAPRHRSKSSTSA